MNSFTFGLKRLFLISGHCPVNDKLLCLADPGIQLIASISNFFYVRAPPNETMHHAPWYLIVYFWNFFYTKGYPKPSNVILADLILLFSLLAHLWRLGWWPAILNDDEGAWWWWWCFSFISKDKTDDLPVGRSLMYISPRIDGYVHLVHIFFLFFVYFVFLWFCHREVAKINCHF